MQLKSKCHQTQIKCDWDHQIQIKRALFIKYKSNARIIKYTSNATQIKYHSNKHQMRMGLSNTNQMRLGYQIQIKCPQHQMHIKHTPNQMAIKYNEYNQMQLKYRSNAN